MYKLFGTGALGLSSIVLEAVGAIAVGYCEKLPEASCVQRLAPRQTHRWSRPSWSVQVVALLGLRNGLKNYCTTASVKRREDMWDKEPCRPRSIKEKSLEELQAPEEEFLSSPWCWRPMVRQLSTFSPWSSVVKQTSTWSPCRTPGWSKWMPKGVHDPMGSLC